MSSPMMLLKVKAFKYRKNDSLSFDLMHDDSGLSGLIVDCDVQCHLFLSPNQEMIPCHDQMKI